MTLNKVTTASIFGEAFADVPLYTFRVRSLGNATGTGYYVSYEVDNTRRKFTAYRIAIVWDNGDVEYSTADSKEELELWTKHMQ